jgi:hypothetical protein
METKIEESRLVFEFNNKQMVELNELGEALNALNSEFSLFAKRENIEVNSNLFIKEVRKGSIIIELVAFSSAILLPVVENVNTVLNFGEYIGKLLNYFTGKTEERPENLDKKNIENVRKIVTPIANNDGSSVSFQVAENNGNITYNYNYNQQETITAKAKCDIEESKLNLPSDSIQRSATMYIYQARNDLKTKVGDKGIISTISNAAKKLVFVNEEIKKEIIGDSENIFNFAYVVDVVIYKKGEIPISYNIIKFHEKFKLEDD